jgi:hypothetical protein
MIAKSVTIIAATIILITYSAFATHGHWIDHYLNDKGWYCCGKDDCLKIPLRILEGNEKSVTLDIQGTPVTIPRKSLHMSEDTFDWLCLVHPKEIPTPDNILCAFIAVGS